MKKVRFALLTLFILIVALALAKSNVIIVGVIVNFITTLVGYIIGIVSENFSDLKLIVACNFKYAKEDIRVSISYLYRIKVDGNYLLVKSRRITEQYQPVGGVYKKYESANKYLDKLGIKDDNGYKIDTDNKDDLRLRVPSKNLIKFIRWFDNREDRELDPTREFREELINEKVLPEKLFQYFKYRFIKQIKNKINYSEHFSCHEILISNIYELLPDAAQLEELKKLANEDNNYYRWFTSNEIESLGHTINKEYRVSPTAKWIL